MSLPDITQKDLKNLLRYYRGTGEFIWKETRGIRAIKGQRAGHQNKNGYWSLRVNLKLYLLHRLAFLYVTGELPKERVDHIDRNPGNNSWKNLRLVTHSENLRNAKLRKDNSSGIGGVYFDKSRKKWAARISISPNKPKNLGRFDTKELAIKARIEAQEKLNYSNCHGTKLNNPERLAPKQMNSSGTIGVSPNKMKNGKIIWKAYIGRDGKQVHLGYYATKNGAILARKEAEKNLNITERTSG